MSFLRECNELRPHQAPGNDTPAGAHERSSCEHPNNITEWGHPKHMVVPYVSLNAVIRWKSYSWVMVSSGLAEKHEGLEELGNGIWRVF